MNVELEVVQQLKHVKVMHLQPGDVLVVRAEGRVSMEAKKRIDALVKDIFPGHKCIVLEQADLAVVRPTQ